MDDDIFADLLAGTSIIKTQPKSEPTPKPSPMVANSPELTSKRMNEAIALPRARSVIDDANETPPVITPPLPAADEQEPMVVVSKAELLELVKSTVQDSVHTTVFGIMKSLRSVLEDMSRRIEAASCPAPADNSAHLSRLEEIIQDLAQNMHARFTTVDHAVKEAERGIQTLRDKHELLDAQNKLAQLSAQVHACEKQRKMDLASEQSHDDAITQKSAVPPCEPPTPVAQPPAPQAPPAPAAATPPPAAPALLPQFSATQPAPQFSAPPAPVYAAAPPAQLPMAPAPAPAPSLAPPAPTLQPQPAAPQPAPARYQPPPGSSPYQAPPGQSPAPPYYSQPSFSAPPPDVYQPPAFQYSSPPAQPPHVQQMASAPQQPTQAPSMPPAPGFPQQGTPQMPAAPMPPAHMQHAPPPPPGAPMAPPPGPENVHAALMGVPPPPPPPLPQLSYGPAVPRYPQPPSLPTLPPSYGQHGQPFGRTVPQAPPVPDRQQPAPATSTTNVPLEQVISDISSMGFERSKVLGVVADLQRNGQSVDLNVILDRLMNGKY